MAHWMQVKTLSENQSPSARWGHSMCAASNDLYLFGGYQNSKYFNDLWKFDLNTLKFTQIQQNGQIPPPCSNFTMNLSEDQTKIILFGGGTLNKDKLNTVYQLNIDTYTWKKLSVNSQDPQPWNRSYHCSEIMGNYLIVFGGQFFHDLDDLWLFDFRNTKWIEVKMNNNALKPKGRKFASSFTYKNIFYIVGGCHSKYEPLSDAYFIDFNLFLETNNPEHLKWSEFKTNNTNLINRWGHVSVVKKNKAYIFGGRLANKDLQNLVSINLITSECKQEHIIGDLPKGRRKPALCIRNSTLFCHSGFDGNYVKDFFQINLLDRPSFQQTYKLIENKEFAKIDQGKRNEKSIEGVYNSHVIKIDISQFRSRVEDIQPYKAACLSTQELATFCIQSKLFSNNQFFKIFKKNHYFEQEFKLYRSQNMQNENQQRILVQTFLLYLKYGKLFITECSTVEQNKLIENLFQLADYYCLFHLQNITKQWLLCNFEKNLRFKKGLLQTLVENGLLIEKYDSQMGEYAGFQCLIKLLKISNITNIYELRLKLKNKSEIKQIGWLLTAMDKFSFQLQQIALSKPRNESQNDIPELNDWSSNEKINSASFCCQNFFDIL